ncbi:UbiA prenyltransferase [Sesbania bispinosa]|nr:UbiA prenyltransferase [Sesbania bispinosa]
MVKGIPGPIADARVCACGGSADTYDDDEGGLQERDKLPMFDGCIVAGGVTLGRALCKDDMEGNCNQGTPTIKASAKTFH